MVAQAKPKKASKAGNGDKTISAKDRLDLLEKWHQSIRAASSAVSKAEEKLSEAKAGVKVCEKKLEQAENLLHQLTRDSPFQTRLFDLQEESAAPAEEKPKAKPKNEKERAACDVNELEISHALVERLYEAGIKTIGDLMKWTDEKPLTEVPGVGTGKAKVIADAWVDWQEKNKASNN